MSRSCPQAVIRFPTKWLQVLYSAGRIGHVVQSGEQKPSGWDRLFEIRGFLFEVGDTFPMRSSPVFVIRADVAGARSWGVPSGNWPLNRTCCCFDSGETPLRVAGVDRDFAPFAAPVPRRRAGMCLQGEPIRERGRGIAMAEAGVLLATRTVALGGVLPVAAGSAGRRFVVHIVGPASSFGNILLADPWAGKRAPLSTSQDGLTRPLARDRLATQPLRGWHELDSLPFVSVEERNRRWSNGLPPEAP